MYMPLPPTLSENREQFNSSRHELRLVGPFLPEKMLFIPPPLSFMVGYPLNDSEKRIIVRDLEPKGIFSTVYIIFKAFAAWETTNLPGPKYVPLLTIPASTLWR